MLMRAALTLLIVASGLIGTVRGETYESFTEPSRRIDVAPAETGVVDGVDVKEGDVVETYELVEKERV